MNIIQELEKKRIDILQNAADEMDRLSKHLEFLKTIKTDGIDKYIESNQKLEKITKFNVTKWNISYDNNEYKSQICDTFLTEYNNLQKSNLLLIESLRSELKRLRNIIYTLSNC
eukprot:544554_1